MTPDPLILACLLASYSILLLVVMTGIAIGQGAFWDGFRDTLRMRW